MITISQEISGITQPSISLVSVPKFTGGTESSGGSYLSVELTTYVGAQAWNDFKFSIPEGVTIENATPNSVSIDTGAGTIERVSGNRAIFRLVGPYGATWTHEISFGYSGSAPSTTPTGFVDGSHPELARVIIEPLLASPNTKPYFSSINHTTFSYVESETCWAKAWDFSGISVWNSRSGNFARACSLITRRHAWCAYHYRLEAGDAVKFRGSNGTIYTYTVLSRTPSDEPTPVGANWCASVGDVCIITLDRDVDASVASYPVADQWVRNATSTPVSNPVVDEADPYLSRIKGGEPNEFVGDWIAGRAHPSFCGLWLDQNRHANFMAIAQGSDNPFATAVSCEFHGQTIPIWIQWFPFETANAPPTFMSGLSSWRKTAIGGDSGSPVFYPLSGTELCIVSVFTASHGGYNPPPSVLNKLILVADAIAGISTGLTVTVAPDPTL